MSRGLKVGDGRQKWLRTPIDTALDGIDMHQFHNSP